jgi:hypothetical protein
MWKPAKLLTTPDPLKQMLTVTILEFMKAAALWFAGFIIFALAGPRF